MPSTREIRRRIKSVKNTAQITKAMQMVAASKMRKAQNAALSSSHYAKLLHSMLATLGDRAQPDAHPLLHTPNSDRQLILLFSTDKGLCGPLNSNLFREAIQFNPSTTDFVASGRKGVQFLARLGRNLLADFSFPDSPSFLQVKGMSKFCIELFLDEKVASVSILYPKFINTLSQKPTLTQILPIQIESLQPIQIPSPQPPGPSSTSPSSNQNLQESLSIIPETFLFEPSPQAILDNLLPYYVHFQVYQMLLSTRASEHSARMVAMKNATDNANQLIKDITLEYNKQRQASITNELLDITTAQRALE